VKHVALPKYDEAEEETRRRSWHFHTRKFSSSLYQPATRCSGSLLAVRPSLPFVHAYVAFRRVEQRPALASLTGPLTFRKGQMSLEKEFAPRLPPSHKNDTVKLGEARTRHPCSKLQAWHFAFASLGGCVASSGAPASRHPFLINTLRNSTSMSPPGSTSEASRWLVGDP
jgi:hypothetical protein